MPDKGIKEAVNILTEKVIHLKSHKVSEKENVILIHFMQ